MTQQELNQRIEEINALEDEPRKMYAMAGQLFKSGENVGLFLQGNAMSLMDKDQEAFQLFYRYTQLEPNDSEGWQYAGIMAATIGKTDQALQLLTHATDMGNMDAACAYASVLVSKGTDLRNQAARMINTNQYDKTNMQAVDCLLEALDIYCFLAQQMPDKLGKGDWAMLQNSVGSLYMLAINNQLESASAKIQLLNSQGLGAGAALHDHAKSRAMSALLAEKMEQVAEIMEKAGRKADAAMTRCRRCVESCIITKNAQDMLDAEGFWECAMQEADRAFGTEKDDWLEYYQMLKANYMRLHRQFEGKLRAMKRKGYAPHISGVKQGPPQAPAAAPVGHGIVNENPLAAASATGSNRRSARSEERQYQRGILKETFEVLRDGFPGIYMFTVIGGMIGSFAQGGLGMGNAMLNTIYAVGVLIAAIGVIKSLKRNPGIRGKLIALVLHVIIWLLMTYFMFPMIFLAVIVAVVLWIKSGQAPRKSKPAVQQSTYQEKGTPMPREIRDANGNIWYLQNDNGDFSEYYSQSGQTERIYHYTINKNYAYGNSGLSFHW